MMVISLIAGDDRLSWAVSGLHGGAFHHNNRSCEFGRSWREGDVVMCFTSINNSGAATISFSLNNEPMMTAVEGVGVTSGLVPVVCLGVGFVGELCCGIDVGPGVIPPGFATLESWFSRNAVAHAT